MIREAYILVLYWKFRRKTRWDWSVDACCGSRPTWWMSPCPPCMTMEWSTLSSQIAFHTSSQSCFHRLTGPMTHTSRLMDRRYLSTIKGPTFSIHKTGILAELVNSITIRALNLITHWFTVPSDSSDRCLIKMGWNSNKWALCPNQRNTIICNH